MPYPTIPCLALPCLTSPQTLPCLSLSLIPLPSSTASLHRFYSSTWSALHMLFTPPLPLLSSSIDSEVYLPFLLLFPSFLPSLLLASLYSVLLFPFSSSLLCHRFMSVRSFPSCLPSLLLPPPHSIFLFPSSSSSLFTH